MSDPAKRALVVIDVQRDYEDGALPIEFPDVQVSLRNVGRAMDAAREAGVPVVVVMTVLPEGAPMLARGTRGADLCDVVASRPCDHAIEKPLPDAFARTDLDEWLQARGVGTIAVAGYMTHNCDCATVLSAAHRGLAVEFLSDATGSLPYENRAGRASAEEIHRAFAVVLQTRFAAVMTTGEWIEGLRTGLFPARDSIAASNRRARGAHLPGAGAHPEGQAPSS
jgi:nicotinamidase-related amidase